MPGFDSLCPYHKEGEIPMNSEQFEKIIEDQIETCKGILLKKAGEYATEGDRLHNFKAAAGMMGCAPTEALAGMMAKHTISIYDMCRSGHSYPMELWNEKITDHINYLLLLKAAVVAESETIGEKANNGFCTTEQLGRGLSAVAAALNGSTNLRNSDE